MTAKFSTVLPQTKRLAMRGDLAAEMVAGIDTYFQKMIEETSDSRYDASRLLTDQEVKSEGYINQKRDRLRALLSVDEVVSTPDLREIIPSSSPNRSPLADADTYTIKTVVWTVNDHLDGEGLLIEPVGTPIADVIALPDCDEIPEDLAGLNDHLPQKRQWIRQLAEQGCRIIVPTLINRDDTHAGIPGVRMTNQPHREFIYRAAYQLGRYVIGFELEKIEAALAWLTASREETRPNVVAGYGEGGLLAFYAGAIEPQFDITVVSGYFANRDILPEEPIYRNIWGLLNEFDDPHIGSLIAPRTLIIESSQHPEITGPPPAREGRAGAAPGCLKTPPLVQRIDTFNNLLALGNKIISPPPFYHLISEAGIGEPLCRETMQALMGIIAPGQELTDKKAVVVQNYDSDPGGRHTRQFNQIMKYTQNLMNASEYNRVFFWKQAERTEAGAWEDNCDGLRDYLWTEIIGKLPPPVERMNPRSRKIYETGDIVGYEIVLDVYDDLFAYGILLIPKGIGDHEKRPVVVCQHGLEGRPQDVADPSSDHEAYHQYAWRLAEKGYITYAPQNPYIGGNTFREILRKAHPLKQSLYAVIVRQHEQTINWLSTLPFVDPARIAFYGLSYGGKTAMRIPAILKTYCLSICSADYNEWIWKNGSVRHGYSYLITGEYDMPEFNLANTFNYAELSWLISPRPFMVERGHDDGVAPDEWVAYEYARTKRHYDKLGIGDKTELEIFDGPHTIHGKGTFDFLERHVGQAGHE